IRSSASWPKIFCPCSKALQDRKTNRDGEGGVCDEQLWKSNHNAEKRHYHDSEPPPRLFSRLARRGRTALAGSQGFDRQLLGPRAAQGDLGDGRMAGYSGPG